jgi:hypothetical protein
MNITTIVAELEKASGTTIEDRVVNWFAEKRITSASGYTGSYSACITDIIDEAQKPGGLPIAQAMLVKRFTCQLCAVDLSHLSRQQKDDIDRDYMMGKQYVCVPCHDRKRRDPPMNIVQR